MIIFTIMLGSDLHRVDRQEKQVKYDRSLVAFMLYFFSDEIWAAVIAGVIPGNLFTVALLNFANYLFTAYITYTWLEYVMAVEQAPRRNRPLNRFAILFPLLVVTAALILTFIVRPQTVITEDLSITGTVYVFQMLVPIIYVVAVMMYTLRRAFEEDNVLEKRKHIYIGLFPLMVVAGALIQVVLLPDVSIFCYCATILMLIFYIQSMEDQISVDALTGLNNKGQILRYTSQPGALTREGRRTFAAMIDANAFKSINDTYGHEEGDHALVLIAEAMKAAVAVSDIPAFIGRYGGDEFMYIVYVNDESEVKGLIMELHSQLADAAAKAQLPYELSVSVGYSELDTENDSFQQCIKRADQALYFEKKRRAQGYGNNIRGIA